MFQSAPAPVGITQRVLHFLAAPNAIRAAAALLMTVLTFAGAGEAFADTDVAGRIQSGGFILTMLFVFGAGVLVSLTPCLYPMIPVTLSVIGAKNVGQKPLDGFLRALVFVLGIAVIYSALGVVAAFSGRSISFVLQYKAFWLFLAVFFAAMGLSMLGMFNIQLPPALAGKLQGATAGKGGYVGAFGVGLVTGIAASPCGSPVLAGLAAYSADKAAQGQVFGSVMLFFSYSLGMGLLFMVLGAFPAFLTKMPKSGGWMEDVKKFLGAVLIGVAVYYLSYAIPGSSKWLWALYWTFIVFALLGTAAVAFIGSTQRRRYPALQNAWRGATALLLLGALYAAFAKVPSAIMTPTAEGQRTVVKSAEPVQPTAKPIDMIAEGKAVLADDARYTALVAQGAPKRNVANTAGGAAKANVVTAENNGSTAAAGNGGAEAAAGAGGEDEWLTDEPSAIAVATKNGLPVLIDFTAEWCANCKKLEKETFTDQAVAAKMGEFIKIKVDVTESNDENEALTKKYKALSFPTIAFIDAKGKRRADLDLKDFEKPAKFLERLKKVAP